MIAQHARDKVKMRVVTLILLLFSLPLHAGHLVEEHNKLINVIGVNVKSNFAYVALLGLETSACPPKGLLKVNVTSAADKTLFSTLLAAKTGNRAVSLKVAVSDSACIVRSAIVH